MPETLLTSPTNPRLKALLALRRRRVREERRQMLVEGYDEISLALAAGAHPAEFYHCPELATDAAAHAALAERARRAGAACARLSRAAFEKVAYREGPDGCLAVMSDVTHEIAELTLPPDPLVLLCEGIEKPGNLGAMLRTADAAGVAAVVAADPVTDWANPNVVRASKGTVFAVPIAAAPTAAALHWVRERGLRLVATTPDTDTTHTDVPLTGPVAVAVGTEKTGLTSEFLAAADVRVRIPMVGRANSLNVATSAAIVLYEAVRQRRARGG